LQLSAKRLDSPTLSLPKTLPAHTNALIGNLIADRDQLEAAESKIGKCK
jgi:hypothetical protein